MWKSQGCVVVCFGREEGGKWPLQPQETVSFQIGRIYDLAASSALLALSKQSIQHQSIQHHRAVCLGVSLMWVVFVFFWSAGIEQTLYQCEEHAVGSVVCSWSLSFGLSPSLSGILLSALWWMLLSGKKYGNMLSFAYLWSASVFMVE